MPHHKMLEAKFVSVDLESSLGIIKDETPADTPSPSQRCTSTNETPSSPPSQGKFVCQPTNTEVVPPPMLLDPSFANQKVTRTSDTYPFARRECKRKRDEDAMNEDTRDEDAMNESDNNKNSDNKGVNRPRITSMSSFEPIPVSDHHHPEADIGSMMMLMQDNDNDEARPQDDTDVFLVNKIGDWSQPQKGKIPRNENGYNIVPIDRDDDAAAWVNIDLSDTEVEDEDDLLSMLEEEAKESGFVLENIGDRQSFWNYNE